MKRCFVRTLLFVALLAPALTPRLAIAADKNEFLQDKKNDIEFSGSITAIDTNAVSVTVRNKEKGPMTFPLAKGCLLFVKHKKSAAALTDFKVGEEVNVLYQQQGAGLVCNSMWQPGADPREKEHKIEKQAQTP